MIVGFAGGPQLGLINWRPDCCSVWWWIETKWDLDWWFSYLLAVIFNYFETWLSSCTRVIPTNLLLLVHVIRLNYFLIYGAWLQIFYYYLRKGKSNSVELFQTIDINVGCAPWGGISPNMLRVPHLTRFNSLALSWLGVIKRWTIIIEQ